jgi:hypothetical protein
MSERELQQIERANATTATPVVFIHGLWLLPSSWDPWAALYEEGNPGVTEIVKVPNRGHSLTIDHGWREVAEIALNFVKRFA